MQVKLNEHSCEVMREQGDQKFYGNFNAAGESQLLYHIQQKLISMGYPVIKKRMCKDGHMVDEMQQYIITRKGFEPSFCIYNSNWAIRGANDEYNNDGGVYLTVERNIWK